MIAPGHQELYLRLAAVLPSYLPMIDALYLAFLGLLELLFLAFARFMGTERHHEHKGCNCY